ncbi:MAG: hypothetical protein HKN74_07325 [Acidimicrobiia bacterium]|nr:hypothetical protein [Acidimicrobiia bacterium]NNF10077.1 hypothetical protein [Acidimicrobiia bacterium]NNL69424.1 hypothetical protein [Acidimicrobiia bacterium]
MVVAAIVYFVMRGTQSPPPDLGTSAAPRQPGRPIPPVAEFHVRGDAAEVYFDVPLPAGEDEVLRKLLLHEAVEVVREKRHSLPIDQVARVVAFGRSGAENKKVGEVGLETPGTLPPPAPPPVVFKPAGPDPLAAFGGSSSSAPPGSAVAVPDEALTKAGSDIELPSEIASGLRLQGVDPAEAGAGDLVVGLLKLGGFTVTGPTATDAYDTYVASNPSGRTFIATEAYDSSAYPELAEKVINRFMVDFEQSGTQRGLFVTDKFGPFLVYEKERREPRVRFVTRERLQQFVDSMALT